MTGFVKGADFLLLSAAAPVESEVTANQSSSKACAALLLGIFRLALPLLSPAAVVFGRKALKDIERSQEQIRGRGGATVGMALGYVGSAWLAFCLLIGGIYLFGYLTGQYPPK